MHAFLLDSGSVDGTKGQVCSSILEELNYKYKKLTEVTPVEIKKGLANLNVEASVIDGAQKILSLDRGEYLSALKHIEP